MKIIEKVGYMSSALLVACGIPELYLGIESGAVGASYWLLILWFAGEILGLMYAASLGKIPLLLNYGLNTIIVGAILMIKLGYL